MSFCSDVKKEILSKKIKMETITAFLSGILKGKSNETENNEIIINTDVIELLKPINKYTLEKYNIACNSYNDISDNETYNIIFPAEISGKIKIDAMIINEKGDKIPGIPLDFWDKDDFIKGIFFSCAYSNITIDSDTDTQKKSRSPYINFTFSEITLARDFSALLFRYEIESKLFKRYNNFIVKINSTGDSIFNLLIKMGVKDCALKYKSIEAIRELNCAVNRQVNCDIANTNKIIKVSEMQREAIELIEETIGISSLQKELQDACYLRLKYPEFSLSELANIDGKITKSGLNHRFSKIMQIAKNLEK